MLGEGEAGESNPAVPVGERTEGVVEPEPGPGPAVALGRRERFLDGVLNPALPSLLPVAR